MTKDSNSKTEPMLLDPRQRHDFLPHLYPKANGRALTLDAAASRNDRIVFEFLAAYYHLNCLYARLLEVRRTPASQERDQAEREQLRAIEKALIERDALEDRYAPIGVVAEPLSKDGLTTDVHFSFGNVDATGRLRSQPLIWSAVLSVPVPPDVKLDQPGHGSPISEK